MRENPTVNSGQTLTISFRLQQLILGRPAALAGFRLARLRRTDIRPRMVEL
jgi:hypothetical protein